MQVFQNLTDLNCPVNYIFLGKPFDYRIHKKIFKVNTLYIIHNYVVFPVFNKMITYYRDIWVPEFCQDKSLFFKFLYGIFSFFFILKYITHFFYNINKTIKINIFCKIYSRHTTDSKRLYNSISIIIKISNIPFGNLFGKRIATTSAELATFRIIFPAFRTVHNTTALNKPMPETPPAK